MTDTADPADVDEPGSSGAAATAEADPPVGAATTEGTAAPRATYVDHQLKQGLRRRPSGERPPLPKHLDRATILWLGLAGMVGVVWIILVSDDEVARTIGIAEGKLVIEVAQHRVEALTSVLTTLDGWFFTWLVPLVGWPAMITMAIFKRWRHFVLFLLSLLVVVIVGGIAEDLIRRARPFGVTILGDWNGWAQPSRPVMMGTAVLVGAYCCLVPTGRWRTIVALGSAALVFLFAAMEIYLGVAHPTDEITAMLIGGAIPLLMFRWFAPENVFPISYKRGGNSAHLDVGGERGAAIRKAVEEQLGMTVLDVKPLGAPGSAGSTPLRLTVSFQLTGDEGQLFAKLLAQSHLRSDRTYKLFRTLAYGRLEDETKFQTVRRLIQAEDYLGLRFAAAGIKVPKTYGIVEITPESEYLLVTDFLDGFGEIGEADVDVEVIDNSLAIVRRMWDTGLAHRDIKPANLMTKGAEVAVIDVGFSQVRPTPWRQAIDLANMMMVLALRSDPELVYQRALLLFTEDDIAEAFAASRSITVPTQLRQYLKADGRDLPAAFRALAPPRQPIKIQRWSARRVGLALGVVLGGLGLLILFIANLQAIGLLPS